MQTAETPTFKQAKVQCQKVGTAHATGPALAAMYADLNRSLYPFGPKIIEAIYRDLVTLDTDDAITEAGREYLQDTTKVWDLEW